MGVCAHKKDHEECEHMSLPADPKGPLQVQVIQSMVDKRKMKHVPVLTLADNPLYMRRNETLKHHETATETLSPMRTLESKVGGC